MQVGFTKVQRWQIMLLDLLLQRQQAAMPSKQPPPPSCASNPPPPPPPSYLLLSTRSTTAPLSLKSHTALCCVSKITTFVLLRLTVSWRCSQKLANASSCFCSPDALSDIRTGSSAYNSRGTVTPMSVGASMAAVSSKCFLSPSTYKSNSVGLSRHPCFTPIRHLKMADMSCEDRIAALSCAYREFWFPGFCRKHQVCPAPATAQHEV